MTVLSDLAYCVERGIKYRVHLFDLSKNTSECTELTKDELQVYLRCLNDIEIHEVTVGQFLNCCVSTDTVRIQNLSRSVTVCEGKPSDIIAKYKDTKSNMLNLKVSYFNMPKMNVKILYIV